MSIFLLCLENDMSEQVLIPSYDSSYAEALERVFPEISIENATRSSALGSFFEYKTLHMYDTQARALINEDEQGYYFGEHYIQTIVIAVDRAQTDEHIESFADVLESNLPVSLDFSEEAGALLWEYPRTHQIVLAFAYGLYDEYSLEQITEDFLKLRVENRFFVNDFSQPVQILYDSTAVRLTEEGRDFEIIVPSDGTLSFIGGLFSHTEATQALSYNASLRNALVEYGYRTIDFYTDREYYPPENAYVNAHFVSDYESFNAAAADVNIELLRNTFGRFTYAPIQFKEDVSMYIPMLFLIVFYFISILKRISVVKVRNAILSVNVLQIFFITCACFKAFVIENAIIEIILWYCYYVGNIFIPALFVYIALQAGYVTNLPRKFERIYKYYFLMSIILLLLVFTNGFHSWVFIVHDYLKGEYTHHTGYFVIVAWIYGSLLLAFALLVYKSLSSPKKWSFLFPFIANLVAFGYTLCYVYEVPIISEFNVAYGTNILIILYLELHLQSRLLPINKGYDKLFTHSHLCMEIRNNKERLVAQSERLRTDNENFVLRCSEIRGGTFSYYEDYTSLNKARHNLAETNAELEANIEFLAQEGKVNAELATLNAEKAAYRRIDQVLEKNVERIEEYLEKIKTSNNIKYFLSKINCIACGIKRECMLLIQSLYEKSQSSEEFIKYFKEMQEFTQELNLNITAASSLEEPFPIQQQIIMYTLFCAVVESCTQMQAKQLLIRIYIQENCLVFSLLSDVLLSENEGFMRYFNEFNEEDTKLVCKAWEESEVVLLTFSANNVQEIKSSGGDKENA